MSTDHLVYNLEREIEGFFEWASATRSACDDYVKEALGGEVTPVPLQGESSYTVFAGPKGESVAQFRFKSLELKKETIALAQSIHGNLVPQVTFKGQIGEDIEGKEQLRIYFMNRIQGNSYLGFLLSHCADVPEESPQFSVWRKNVIADIARYEKIWIYIRNFFFFFFPSDR